MIFPHKKNKIDDKQRAKKKYKSSHGAVTIFLTLLLLPCMIFTCAFGDVSRVLLSKSQAVAASDLALYSLMAHYDEDLKEWYGLVASVDNIDEFYSVTAEYFTGMMSAKGLDGTASELFTAYLSSLQTGKNFSDFLQVEVTGATTVDAAPDAGMGGNPALIEDGIVEFMKYRGPVSLASRIYHRFTSTNAVGSLSDASENQPITEKKQEFAEAEGEMMEKLLYTYVALINYDDYRISTGVPDLQKYQNVYAEHLSQIRDDLPKVTQLIARYYSYSDGISDAASGFRSFNQPGFKGEDEVKEPNSGKTFTYDDIGAEEEDGNYSIGASELSSLTQNVDSYLNAVNNAASNVVNTYQNAGLEKPTSTNGLNPVVYCMQFQNLGLTNDLNTVNSNAAALMTIYAKLLLAQTCSMPGKVQPEDPDWPGIVSSALSRIESARSSYMSYADKSSTFETILADYYDVAVNQGTVKSVKDRQYEFYSEYCGASVTVGKFFEAVRSEFGTLVEQLDHQLEQIDIVINGGTTSYHGRDYHPVSLTELKAKIKEYTDKRNDWGDESYKHSTDYAKDEQKEYEREPSNQGEKLAAALEGDGEEAVEVLRTRLTNIRSDMQTLRDKLEAFTYGGTPIYSMTRESAISAGKTVMPTDVSGVSRKLSENDSAAEGYHPKLVSPATGDIYTPPTRVGGEDGNEPDLNSDIPKLYQYMVEAFPRSKIDSAMDAKEQFEEECKENEGKAQEQADSAQEVDDSQLDGKGESLPETTGGNGFGVVTVLKALVNTIEKLIDGDFGEFRDQIYVVEYAMDMFSYSTFNNEGRYHLIEAHENTNITSNYTSKYKDYDEEWGKDDPTELNVISWNYNQSLTNRQINAENNHANLGEIEYLLYGKSKFNDNLKAAYTDIFVIRLALNIASGFQNFYTPKDANNVTAIAIETIADIIQGVTMGLVPVPLTKCIIIGILAVCETAYDLKRLKAGVPVKLYKDSYEDWMFELSGTKIANLFSSADNPDLEPVDKDGLFYSDYMYIFMLMMAGSNDSYKSMLLRIGDLVEANVAKGKGEDFDLESSMVYFQLNSTLEVKPLLMNLGLVDSMQGYGVDPSGVREATGWRTYKVSIFRGYS